MTGINQTSQAANAVTPLASQERTVESFLRTPLGDSQLAKHSIGDGCMTEGWREKSDAVRFEFTVELGDEDMIQGLREESDALRFEFTAECQNLTTESLEASSLKDSSAPDDEEFFDPDEYPAEGGEKAFAAPQAHAHPVGRDVLGRADHVAADSSEVQRSPAESKPDTEGNGIHGEDRLPKVGNGEKSAKVKEELRVQQGWIWSALQGVGRAMGAVVTVVGSYFNRGQPSAGPSGNSDLAGVSGPKRKEAGTPRVAAFANTAAAKSGARIRELTANIELAFAKLNQQLIEKYQMPELAQGRKAGSVHVPLTFWDDLGRMGHRMYGFGSAGVSTVGQVRVAAAIPSEAGVLPVGITARIAAMAWGMWLGLRALADMPDKANAVAALSHVDSELAATKPILDELKSLLERERQREAGGGKIMMVSLERDQRINELEREKQLLSNALARAEVGGTDVNEFLEHPIALGSGKSRAQILSERQFGKSAFQSFFTSISQALSNLVGFLGSLPNIFFGDASRREAARSEDAYINAYRDAFRALSSRAENSGIHVVADPVTRMMQEGYSDEEMERRHAEVGAQLYRGENLLRLIGGNEQIAFGQLTVASENAPDIKYTVPASLSLARDMASYFSLMADKDADDQGFEVVRNEDRSLTVADPKGQLYSFLMSVPSAYTSGMAGVNGGGALASLTLDDHSAGFPGGARSMRFERALQLDSSGNPVVNEEGGFVSSLRVVFLADQPQPIYAPLANEGLTLRRMAVRKHIAERRGLEGALTETEVAAAKEYARMEPDELEDRLQRVTQDLERNRALLQVEQAQFKALQNWNA